MGSENISLQLQTEDAGVMATIDEEKEAILAAAKRGDSETLQLLLKKFSSINCVEYTDSNLGRNALHWACDAANPNDAFQSFQEIIEFVENCLDDEDDDDAKLLNYLDLPDKNMETALHISIKNYCTEITKMLIMKGVDVEIKSRAHQTQIELLFQCDRKFLRHDMNESVNYVGESKRCNMCGSDSLRNQMKEKYTFCLHFGDFVLYDNQVPSQLPETPTEIVIYDYSNEMKVVHFISQNGLRSGKEVFSHPLLKCFLYLKWKKMERLISFLMIYYVSWLFLHFVITTTIYIFLCPSQTNVTAATDQTECKLEKPTYYLTVVFMCAASIIPSLVEVLQMVTLKMAYFQDMKNYAQWFLIVQTIIQLLCFSFIYSQRWARVIASMAVLCAIFLLLAQLDEFPGIFKDVKHLNLLFRWINVRYFNIFRNLLKKLCFLLIPFAFLIIGFHLAFNILIPQVAHFSISFESYIKLVALATSQLSYDETFGGEYIKGIESHEKNLVLVLYAVFLIVIVLVWFNFLIGVTVADIRTESRNAKIKNISVRIGKLYFMESLLIYLAKKFEFMKQKLEAISLLERSRPKNEETCFHIHKSELSMFVVQEMRDLINRKSQTGNRKQSRNFHLSDNSISSSSTDSLIG